jgi:hypothetical protein
MHKIQQGNEDLNSNAGIVLVGTSLGRLRSLRKIDRMNTKRIQHGWTPHSDILSSVFIMQTLGRNEFADIELFRRDRLFKGG